jgi:hypothetical protein
LDLIPTGFASEDVQLLRIVTQSARIGLGEWCTTTRGNALQRNLKPEGEVPVLAGRDLRSFEPPNFTHYVSLAEVEAMKLRWVNPPQLAFQNIVAHISRPSDHIRLIGTVVKSRCLALDTVNLLSIKHPDITPHAMAGFLMSDLVGWFVYVVLYNRAIRTMHFDGYFLERIRVPEVAAVAGLATAAKSVESAPDSIADWARLNEAVFEAYGIPAKLREYVTRMHQRSPLAIPRCKD